MIKNELFKYKCGLVQMNSVPDISKNMKEAELGIDETAKLGSDLICLPECTPYLGPDERLIKNIDQIEKKLNTLLSEKSKQYKVSILAGGYRKSKNPKKVYNCLFWSNPDGICKPIYDKINRFDVNIPDGVNYQESNYIEKGSNEFPIFVTKNLGTLALSICYDLRFPEHFRRQTKKGSNVILIPAAFTSYTGKSHWEVLLRARAIENLSYVIAPAQTGLHFGKRDSHGHSMVINPWGEIVAKLNSNPGVLVVNINESQIIKARNSIPSSRPENID